MMKKADYFLGVLIVFVVAVAMVLLPNIYYSFYDSNVVNAAETAEEFTVENVEISLAPEEYLRFMNEGNSTVMRSEVFLSDEEFMSILSEAVADLSTYLDTNETEEKALITFLILNPDLELWTTQYEVLTYSGSLDGKPVTISMLGAIVTFGEGEIGYSIQMDMVSKTIYYFSGSGVPGTAGYSEKEKYSHKAEKELLADLSEYWNITDENILSEVECHVAPNDCFAFSLVPFVEKEELTQEKVYMD